jgi:hypothetical protein
VFFEPKADCASLHPPLGGGPPLFERPSATPEILIFANKPKKEQNQNTATGAIDASKKEQNQNTATGAIDAFKKEQNQNTATGATGATGAAIKKLPSPAPPTP